MVDRSELCRPASAIASTMRRPALDGALSMVAKPARPRLISDTRPPEPQLESALATEPDPLIALYGTQQPPAEIRSFARGPLTFDLEAGKLRYIRLGGREVLRCIAFVVRGPGWESPAPSITDFETRESDKALHLGYRASYETAGGKLEVLASIEACANGLTFEAEARALTDFTTARTSFCILHPLAGVAGQALTIVHPDESVEPAQFPDRISAHQPFMNIRALKHEVAPGLWAGIRMEGDVWEMEDQRNWTDASFKTYGRPRDLPWPYTIANGERVVQRAILDFEGPTPVAAAPRSSGVEISLHEGAIGRLPSVALALAPDEVAHAAAVKAPLPAQQLIGWFELGAQQVDDLKAYAGLGRRLGVPVGLEVVLPCRRPVAEEMGEVAALLREADLRPSGILPIQAPMTKWVLKPPEELGLPGFAELYAAARRALPEVAIGAGVTSNFTELNIDRPTLEGAAFVSHGTAAVIHEPDDRSVMETLETLPHIFASVRAMAGALPYRIGPSAIGMRYNPYGKTLEANRENLRVAFARQDPRQRGLFGAAFALGYYARAARAGLDAVCFGAPTGPFGLIYRRSDYPQPWFDGRSGSAVYPVFHVIAGLAAAGNAEVLGADSSDEKRVLALGYRVPKGDIVLWLANLTAASQDVELAGAALANATERRLDAQSFAAVTSGPDGFASTDQRPLTGRRLCLGPYAVVQLQAHTG